jgi:transcriptional regulator with XRE-family HTH domain
MGYSREKLAQAVGINAVQLARYEYEQNDPTSDTLLRLARFFSVSSDYLLGNTDIPSPTLNLEEPPLSEKELAAITAWRRGERYQAIKIIVSDENGQIA